MSDLFLWGGLVVWVTVVGSLGLLCYRKEARLTREYLRQLKAPIPPTPTCHCEERD